MRLRVTAIWVCIVTCLPLPVFAQEHWESPHISVTKVSSWSEFLDLLNQPHIDIAIRNDGNTAVGTLDFRCRLFLLDRANPIFDDGWTTTLDRVIRPGDARTLKLTPNMFGELGQIIQQGYRNASWSCFVSRVLTSDGRNINFEPGAIPHKGPVLGIVYTPVPPNMTAPLKLGGGGGMWVLKVQDGSIAEVAGLRVGDVIVEIDGKPLKAVRDLATAFDDATSAGRAADLSVIRAGSPIHVSIQLTSTVGAN